ncbi:hypothetical protein [Actinokineospora sp.]|uniref:hypothetical protein n=1 Tax=Actinokineospora sp. TaxID=1872133 RepID=UPI003D6A552F
MQSLFLVLAAVACPVGMGLMMWMMMRGRNQGSGDSGGQRQVARLREEIEELKAERTAQRTKGGQ